MGQSTVPQGRFPAAPKPPPRLRTIYVLAGFAVFMTGALAYKAWDAYARPFPSWMTFAGRWYDHAIEALFWLGVAVACIAYVRHRLRSSRVDPVAIPRPWHLRHEVRFVLYLGATTQLVQLPLAVYKVISAANDATAPAFATRSVAPFLGNGLLPAMVGMAIIVYDRRRAAREERLAGNLCLACGYDLRFSPERCPECGTVPTCGDSAPA